MASRSLNYVSFPWVMLALHSLYSLLATSGNCLVSLDSLVASSVTNLTRTNGNPLVMEAAIKAFAAVAIVAVVFCC